jgi:hypothetical protein
MVGFLRRVSFINHTFLCSTEVKVKIYGARFHQNFPKLIKSAQDVGYETEAGMGH